MRVGATSTEYDVLVSALDGIVRNTHGDDGFLPFRR